MIELMEIIALIVGILIGLYWFKGTAEYILILLYLAPYRTESKFEWFYDHADDEVTFSFIGTQLDGVKVYSDYYRLHQAARATSYEYFKKYYVGLTSIFFNLKITIVLIPALLFWAHWYVYLLGLLAGLIIVVLYKVMNNGCSIGYYQRLIIFAVIKDYQQQPENQKSK
jgi:hypothetical protein